MNRPSQVLKGVTTSAPVAVAALCLAAVVAAAIPYWTVAAGAQSPTEKFTGPADFSELAKAKLPAVVNISTTQEVEGMEGPRPFPEMPELPPGSPFEDFFRDFFDRFQDEFQNRDRGGAPDLAPRNMTALGSGFIIDPEGYVVTNNHVIANADEIKVLLQDDTELEAEVVGHDPKTDLALLKVDAGEPLPALEWGNSDTVEVGDWIVAIGNPFGLGGTVTAGIISARARVIQAGPYDDFLQTDAAINRGNSGGPMFSIDGKVIGVNTAIFSPSGGNVGIGFAVPSEIARYVIQQLKETGRVARGWLGVTIQPITEEIAQAVGLDEPRGALVATVAPNSPASEAGIQSGDVILEFDGEKVGEMRELPRIVAEAKVGKTVDILVWRDRDEQTLSAEIALLEEPEQMAGAEPDGGEQEGSADALGMSLATLDRELRSQFGLEEGTKGVVVLEVEPGSPAARQGIRRGDVIVKAGKEEVTKPQDVADAVMEAKENGQKSVLLLRERDGTQLFVALPTESKKG